MRISEWGSDVCSSDLVDITSGKFVFSTSEAYMIENGKVTYPVKGATLIGNGPDAMNRVSFIGNDLQLDSGVGTCGKEGKSVPVGVGMQTVSMEGLTVGGTAGKQARKSVGEGRSVSEGVDIGGGRGNK